MLFLCNLISTIPLITNPDYSGELNGELSAKQKLVYYQIKEQPGVQATEIASVLNIPFSSVDKYIRKLLEMNLIERKGSKKTGGYFSK